MVGDSVIKQFVSLLIIIFLFLFTLPAGALAGDSAYENTLLGKQCRESSQQINCTYKVGEDLEFSIDGIGITDTGITFTRSKGLEGDYYASFGLMHGCVIVKHGGGSELFGVDFAFVSPKNGKVYRKWEDCKAGY